MTDERWTETRPVPEHHHYTYRMVPHALRDAAPDDEWTCDWCDCSADVPPAAVLTNGRGVQAYVCAHCWAAIDRLASFAQDGPLAFRIGPDVDVLPAGERADPVQRSRGGVDPEEA